MKSPRLTVSPSSMFPLCPWVAILAVAMTLASAEFQSKPFLRTESFDIDLGWDGQCGALTYSLSGK